MASRSGFVLGVTLVFTACAGPDAEDMTNNSLAVEGAVSQELSVAC